MNKRKNVKNRVKRKKLAKQQRSKRQLRASLDRRTTRDIKPMLEKIKDHLQKEENERRHELQEHPELYWKELGNLPPRRIR